MNKLMMQNKTDCMNTCLSMLLDIAYEEIPHFYASEIGFYLAYNSWLLENGFQSLYIEMNPRTIPYRFSSEGYCLGVLYKDNRSHEHAVIMKFEKGTGFEIFHDPKPNTDYTIDDLIGFELVYQSRRNI